MQYSQVRQHVIHIQMHYHLLNQIVNLIREIIKVSIVVKKKKPTDNQNQKSNIRNSDVFDATIFEIAQLKMGT